MEIINLDESVSKALDFFIQNTTPTIDLSEFNLPFVVGSGNAYNTGMILFSNKAAVFADESNFKNIIESYKPVIEKGLIKDAIIISASGEKDSVWEIELAKSYGLKTTLLTCSEDSSSAKIASKVIAYRKIAEPYTYNVSTYLGMVLSATGEKSEKIKSLIQELKLPADFGLYKSYAFILPDEYLNICPMLDIKKSELFGGHISIRAFSQGHARHAKFVVPSEDELVISVNSKNEYFGHPQHRWDIALSEESGFAEMLCLTYYLVGKIQKVKPSYFKENIENYCKDYGPKAYGKTEPFEVIVPGN